MVINGYVSKKLFRFAVALGVLGLLAPASSTPASAASLLYQETSAGNFDNPSTLLPQFRISNIEVTVEADNPDILITKVNFTGNLKADSFVPGLTNPLLRIKIFKKWVKGDSIDGGYGDIWIDSPKVRYPYQNNQIPTTASAMRYLGASPYDSRVSMDGCLPVSWIDPTGQNMWIKFAISMTCFKIPDKFNITAFVDADTNANYQIDYKYAPSSPMAIDLTGVNRPRIKDEQVVTVGQQSDIDLRTTSVNISASNQKTDLYGSTSQGLPIVYTSLTPAICNFLSNNQGLLAISAKGYCKVDAFSPGNDKVKDSNHAVMQFLVNPKPKVGQTIYYQSQENMTLGDAPQELGITSSSGLPVVMQSLTPSVCDFLEPSTRPSLLTALSPGQCQYRMYQSGNDDFLEANAYGSLTVDPRPEKEPPTPPASGSSGSSGGSKSGSSGSSGGGTNSGTSDGVKIGISGQASGTGTITETAPNTTFGTTMKQIVCYNPKKTSQKKTIKGTNPQCPKGWKKK